MPKLKTPGDSLNAAAISECVDSLVEALSPIDFAVDADDFILYELNRLIEEDRASFEDEEFRILIDEGIREHVEENLPVRSRMASALRAVSRGSTPVDAARTRPAMRAVADRIIRALENTDSDLRNVAFVVRQYAAYLFDRLQSIETTPPGEAESRECIESWKRGEIPKEKLIADLRQTGRASLGPIADLLLNSPEDRNSVDTALAVLSSVRSSVSARVLAYAVSEPMLDEDFEARAYAGLREFWVLARPYILHSLHTHAHEDLPFRWFQLLIEVDEVTSSELIYEEMRVHGDKPNYHEDLWALTSLMVRSRDPEIEDKVLGWINSPQTPKPVLPMLQEFLKEDRKPELTASRDPWTERARLKLVNETYIGAARLFDSGRVEDANRALGQILAEEPGYPFAFALQEFGRKFGGR